MKKRTSRNSLRRLLTLALTLVMCISLLNITALAAETTETDDPAPETTGEGTDPGQESQDADVQTDSSEEPDQESQDADVQTDSSEEPGQDSQDADTQVDSSEEDPSQVPQSIALNEETGDPQELVCTCAKKCVYTGDQTCPLCSTLKNSNEFLLQCTGEDPNETIAQGLKDRLDKLPAPENIEKLTFSEINEIKDINTTANKYFPNQRAFYLDEYQYKLTALFAKQSLATKFQFFNDEHVTVSNYKNNAIGISASDLRSSYNNFIAHEEELGLEPGTLSKCKDLERYDRLLQVEYELAELKKESAAAYLGEVMAPPENAEKYVTWVTNCQALWEAVQADETVDKTLPLFRELEPRLDMNSGFALNRLIQAADGVLELSGTYTVGETVQISKSLTIRGLGELTLKRAEGFTGPVLQVNASKTGKNEVKLEDLTVDGSAISESDPLLVIAKGAKGEIEGKVTLGSGVTLRNNTGITSNKGQHMYSGGAVRCYGELVMEDGSLIENCTGANGGGVYLYGDTYNGKTASFVMEGGTIQSCTATIPKFQTLNYDIGMGGGVCVDGAALFTMKGGTIQNCEAGFGGGVAIGNRFTFTGFGNVADQFLMQGGTIDGNRAMANGGGLFIFHNGCSAVIEAGRITNNQCALDYANTGSLAYYGGGGIYVDGNRGGTTGKLKVYNAKITDNQASYEGGGVAGCPYSKVSIYLDQGGIIFGNTAGYDKGANGADQQVFVTSSRFGDSGNPTVYISPVMLGGSRYNWTHQDGTTIPDEDLLVSLSLDREEIAAYNTLTADSAEAQKAEPEVRTVISGNISKAAGGGIGTNGSVEIGYGTEQDATVSIWVKKVWNDNEFSSIRPEKVRFWLLRDGVRIGSMLLEAVSGKGYSDAPQELFKGLRKYNPYTGEEYTYTIEEEFTGQYAVTVEPGDPDSKNNPWVFTNTPLFAFQVEKQVEGKETTQKFTFDITLNDAEGNPYSGEVETVDQSGAAGTVTFVDGKASIQLADGESLRLEGLAVGMTYTVTEAPNDADSTTVTVNGEAAETAEGEIHLGTDFLVFVNGYEPETPPPPYIPTPEYGALTVSKVVVGGGDEAAEKTYSFTVTGPNGYSATVTVTGSGSQTLTGLTPGEYAVTEADASIEGFTWTVSGEGSVTVAANATASVTVTNTYEPNTPPEEPDEPDEDIPDEDTPQEEIPEIPDEEPPLAELPEEEPPVEIPEEDVPLDESPKTGDNTRLILWLALAMSSGMGLVLLGAQDRKGKERQN